MRQVFCFAAGKRWQRCPVLGQSAAWLRNQRIKPGGKLGIPNSTRPGLECKIYPLASRSVDRWFKFNQRDGLCARAGAKGWDWQTVRPIYDRMETRSDIGQHGRQSQGDGPVWVSDLSDQMAPFSHTFLQAAKDMGHAVIPDMNAPDTSGVSYYRSTVRKGIRWSSADAFLRPAQKRPNLTVITKANVNRLISAGPTVKGVTFNRGHQVQVATANREVILCAGAINSPKILQLSGFGPAKTLRRHGIAVRRDLPQVGQGLQDHLEAPNLGK